MVHDVKFLDPFSDAVFFLKEFWHVHRNLVAVGLELTHDAVCCMEC